jgi:xyloglucan-specific endo-beta-1,4-glucanase
MVDREGTERVCGHDESLVRGRFLLLNNLWGASAGSGSQCLWAPAPGLADESRGIAWGTDWDWQGPTDSVKSYVGAVLGWHWGWPLAGSGLPVRLSSIERARASWAFELRQTRPGPQNVAFDIWIAVTPDPTMADLTDEVMIWLHRSGGATPIGALRERVAVDGAEWDLWEGPHPERGWTVHSFVRVENAAAADLDLRLFFEALVRRGMRDDTWLVGVQAGTEVFAGAGTLETTRYGVEIAAGPGRQ